MPTAHSKEVVTSALLVIGGKILSGRTKDQNIDYIAEYLTAVCINLREVRVVGDEERAIIDALNALRRRYTYVFTTGGIGPTHGDITADCVAKAFGVPIDSDPRALATARMEEDDRSRDERGPPSHDAHSQVRGRSAFACSRKRCARMRAKATSGCNSARSARPIRHAIGSYPFFDPQHGPNTNVVRRARDAQKLALAKRAVEDMLERVRQNLALSRRKQGFESPRERQQFQ